MAATSLASSLGNRRLLLAACVDSLRKLDADYDVHDRLAAMSFLQHHAAKGQIVTGLLYVAAEADEMHGHLNTVEPPLNALSEAELCPGSAALDKFNASLR